jgi:hypothetical protein
MAHPLALLFAEKCQPPAGSAAKAALATAWGLDQLPRGSNNSPRLLVNIAIAPQIARIVVNDLLVVLDCRQLAEMPG